MESLKELQKWVHSLSKGEKRSITLLGQARSGNAPSQQLILFDWLNSADLEKEELTDPSIISNLPTVVLRLRELILDALRLLHKKATLDAELRTSLDNAANLVEKRFYASATRLLEKTKTKAMDASRYAMALLCIQMEQQILLAKPDADFPDQLRSLRNEELVCIKRFTDLQDLQYRYGLLRTKSKQFMGTRIPAELEEVRRLLADGFVERMRQEGAFLEHALAVNILGIVKLFERESVAALDGYHQLLTKWGQHAEWHKDQGLLLYNITVNFLNAWVTSPLSWEVATQYLEVLPDHTLFAPNLAVEYQRTLILNKFVVALNLGDFPLVASLVIEAETWLSNNAAQLQPRLVLAFLHNMAINAFIIGNVSNALRLITKIVNMPNQKEREDIRDFALVLRAVLLFESGDTNFMEHMTRSAKRHFKKNTREFEFELAVFQFLERAIRQNSQQQLNKDLDKLISELDRLSEAIPGTVPLLGLAEMNLWAKSKREKRPLQAVFLDAVRANLESLS